MAIIKVYVDGNYTRDVYIDQELKRGQDILQLSEAFQKYDLLSTETLTKVDHEDQTGIINFIGYNGPKTTDEDFTE
jgi:hypothetical protein